MTRRHAQEKRRAREAKAAGGRGREDRGREKGPSLRREKEQGEEARGSEGRKRTGQPIVVTGREDPSAKTTRCRCMTPQVMYFLLHHLNKATENGGEEAATEERNKPKPDLTNTPRLQ